MVTAALIFKAETSFSQVYQLENPGFEDWDGGSNDEPTHWNSFPSAKVDISVGSGLVTGKKHDRSTDKRPGSDGSLSCKIYSTSISIPLLGTFVANGTLTTGRIRVGAASTTSAENYNYTDANDANFRQALNAKPDSIVFWARFFNSNEADEASAHAYIHDDFSFKDPITANNNYAEHLVGKAEENFTRQGSEWVRHSCPFDYTVGQSNDPQYVLLTFTTNKTAGGGAANDSLLIDDILFIYNPIRHEISETSCGTFIWDGTEYSESGDFEKTYTVGPRDSIVTLHLTISQPTSNEITETACESFTWNDSVYTTSNDYTQTFIAANGCDSVVTLHLTINQPTSSEITETGCGIFTWNDSVYTTSNDYTQTFTAANGCDSIVTLHLTINPAPTREETAEQCGGSYSWYDEVYTTSGTYYATVESTEPGACDSVIILHLAIYDAVEDEINESACDSFTWNNHEYTESGTYTDTLETINGCDSIVTLHLTINYSVTNEISEEAEDSYTWNETEYTVSGDYEQSFETVNGCDSIVTLHLTITTTGINENKLGSINVYPVPANDRISIEGKDIKSVTICDIAGREIAEYNNATRETMSISLDNFTSGSYLLVIKNEDGSIATRQISILK